MKKLFGNLNAVIFFATLVFPGSMLVYSFLGNSLCPYEGCEGNLLVERIVLILAFILGMFLSWKYGGRKKST